LPLSFWVALVPALRSLAEEEIKTESDVVEGMEAAVRSKGESSEAEREPFQLLQPSSETVKRLFTASH